MCAVHHPTAGRDGPMYLPPFRRAHTKASGRGSAWSPPPAVSAGPSQRALRYRRHGRSGPTRAVFVSVCAWAQMHLGDPFRPPRCPEAT